MAFQVGLFRPTIMVLLFAVWVFPGFKLDQLMAQGRAIHLSYERTGVMGGMTSRPKPMEIWIADSIAKVVDGRRTYVYRYDLGKLWMLDMKAKTFQESDTVFIPNVNPSKDMTSYYWYLSGAARIDSVHGLQCRSFELTGEAEVSEVKANMTLIDQIRSPLARFVNGHLRPFFMSTEQWMSLRVSVTLLSTYLIAEIRWGKSEGGQAEESFDTFKLVARSESTFDSSLFDVPADYQRMNSDRDQR